MPPIVLRYGELALQHPIIIGQPTVNAAKYSGPIANLRKRPTGTLNVPVTLAGVNSRNVISLSFGITFTHSL